MLFTQLLLIAIVQGLTEFLPISSSGHLILLPHVTGWPDLGLAYDVAAHFGTLIAVVAYFRNDLCCMARAWLTQVFGGASTVDSRLAWAVLWGTLPVALFGLVAHDFIAANFRNPVIVALSTIGFGAVLWACDYYGRRERKLDRLSAVDIGLVGLSQCLALIPGTSRSGITMSAALALGFTRDAAARFSFLLSVPVIALATVYESWGLMHSDVSVNWGGLCAVVVGACVSAFICIAVFLRLLERVGMLPFVLYRFALGIVLLLLYLEI